MSAAATSSSVGMCRVKPGELVVGAPLRFDVFDADRRLLLRRGNRINSESQLRRLLEQGLFFGRPPGGGAGREQPASLPHSNDPARSHPAEVSTFRMLDDCARCLDTLLRTPPGSVEAGRFADEVRELAARVQLLCRSDSDAALAYALLGQAPNYAVRQQINVAILGALMLCRLAPGAVRAEALLCAALTMNLGMLDLQEELYWADRPLDEDQRAAVRRHPQAGVQALRALGVADGGWLEMVGQHHEALNGSGYPEGLGGGQICREARIIAIADRYNGMVMNRAYRAGIAPDFALKELARRDGPALDASMLGLLIKAIGVYPPGTVVALANKEVGVVTTRLLDLKHPVVRTFFLEADWPYERPVKRFTGKMPQFAVARVLPRDGLNFTIDPEQLWPPACLVESSH